MDGLNRVVLLGNLGQDPELTFVGEAGSPVCEFSLATERSWMSSDGKRETAVEWHRVQVWGKRGTALARVLERGQRILVEGELRTRSWEDGGVRHYRTQVVARNVVFAGASSRKEQ